MFFQNCFYFPISIFLSVCTNPIRLRSETDKTVKLSFKICGVAIKRASFEFRLCENHLIWNKDRRRARKCTRRQHVLCPFGHIGHPKQSLRKDNCKNRVVSVRFLNGYNTSETIIKTNCTNMSVSDALRTLIVFVTNYWLYKRTFRHV